MLYLNGLGYIKMISGNHDFYSYESKGTIAGEGAFFFLLSNERSEQNIAKLDGMEMFYNASNNEVEAKIKTFLAEQNLSVNDVDLIITGRNGDKKNDAVYDALEATVFAGKSVINYKHLCGEYPTSTSFALWLAAVIIKDKNVLQALYKQPFEKDIKKILIYNHYLNTYHSLLLLSAC